MFPTSFMFAVALQDRLLDYDEKVRVAVVKAIYDLAISDLKLVSIDVLRKVSERLRDKKVLVWESLICTFSP